MECNSSFLSLRDNMYIFVTFYSRPHPEERIWIPCSVIRPSASRKITNPIVDGSAWNYRTSIETECIILTKDEEAFFVCSERTFEKNMLGILMWVPAGCHPCFPWCHHVLFL